MYRRYYERIQVNLQTDFVICDNENGLREFIGYIDDISEGGIRIFVEDGEFDEIVSTIRTGMHIKFQSVDEYSLFGEERMDIFMGEVEVLRIERDGNKSYFGCRYIEMNLDLQDYIAHKKTSAFMDNMARVSEN